MRIELLDVGMIVASCGKGKTRLALEVARGNLEVGKNVMYITVENSEVWVERNINSNSGWLVVDELLMGNSNLSDIEELMIKWRKKIGFEPDVLVIDNIEYIGGQYLSIDQKLRYLSELQYSYDIDVWTTLNGRRIR